MGSNLGNLVTWRSRRWLLFDRHDLQLRQDLVDEVGDLGAATVAALLGIAELQVADEDVGQHGPQPFSDILDNKFNKLATETLFSRLVGYRAVVCK